VADGRATVELTGVPQVIVGQHLELVVSGQNIRTLVPRKQEELAIRRRR
jgi:hypothetical protein